GSRVPHALNDRQPSRIELGVKMGEARVETGPRIDRKQLRARQTDPATGRPVSGVGKGNNRIQAIVASCHVDDDEERVRGGGLVNLAAVPEDASRRPFRPRGDRRRGHAGARDEGSPIDGHGSSYWSWYSGLDIKR